MGENCFLVQGVAIVGKLNVSDVTNSINNPVVIVV